ncbi:BPSL0761 family protein [Rhodanobacter sp. PCA2]|uniref:BPSL0761 family protein n=1 Tax=Rhodanobacter sp. PCA2 TaxID=2006117 RepID=UPI0015E74D1E|nr:BPSL0761 family protein [Rhodanobacter sp. PCA2]MBA2079839.1 hypothetical protein [Rhodanobacter sp. PCA2]
MTMPNERTRALVWAGGFLIELARDRSLPLDVRRSAVSIARHFPTLEDISSMALLYHPLGFGPMLKSPDEVDPGIEAGRFGPLRYSTRLAWPEEA